MRQRAVEKELSGIRERSAPNSVMEDWRGWFFSNNGALLAMLSPLQEMKPAALRSKCGALLTFFILARGIGCRLECNKRQ